MRAGAPDEVLSGAAGWWPVVQSWYGGRLIAADVPVLRGRVAASTTTDVQQRLTMTVPRWDGRDWLPRATDDPLARFGQELQVSIVVWSAVTGNTWTTRVGRFLITDTDLDDGASTIEVRGEAVGLRRMRDARLTGSTVPAEGGTLVSEARRLMPAGVSASIAAGLVDRPVPSMEWTSDRLAAVREIADAWPALLRADEWGQVALRAPLPAVPSPVLSLRDGMPYRGLPGDPRGTVIGAARSDTRDGAYNEVVARSSGTSGDEVVAVARQTTGPMSVTGPYGPVTREWASPLIDSQATAQASAETMLTNSLAPSRVLPVTHVPDPRIDLDDPVEVIRDGVTDWGWVVGYDLPLTVRDGAMRTDVGLVA